MINSNSVLLLKSPNPDENEDKYEKILKSHNFDVRQVKTLIFNFKNLKPLKERLENASSYSGLILSSPRCVQAVQMVFNNNKQQFEEWKTKSNYVVGEATYKAALEKLALECNGKESGNALTLSKLIIDKKTNYTKPFLFPHGNLKTDTLNIELSKEGLQIEGIEVYDTIANPDIKKDLAEATDNFTSISEYLVFFSPSGFSSAIDYIKKVPVDLSQVKFVAIGPVTETAITERDFSVFGVAKQPNPENIVKVILNK